MFSVFYCFFFSVYIVCCCWLLLNVLDLFLICLECYWCSFDFFWFMIAISWCFVVLFLVLLIVLDCSWCFLIVLDWHWVQLEKTTKTLFIDFNYKQSIRKKNTSQRKIREKKFGLGGWFLGVSCHRVESSGIQIQ